MNFLSLLSNFGAVTDKAPQLIGDALDDLLRESADKIDRDNGENELLFIMHPVGRNNPDGKKEYLISIAAIDKDNTIKRIISSITLSNLLATILNSINNA